MDSQEEEGELQKKTRQFLELLEDFREKMTYATVSDMIQDIYSCTKLDYMMSAMSNGLQRKANLELLMEVARSLTALPIRGCTSLSDISAASKRERKI